MKINSEEATGQVLELVGNLSGEVNLPVRTSFELSQALLRYFRALDKARAEQPKGGSLYEGAGREQV